MSNDIQNYIKSCDVCPRTNDAKFVKAGCELHPIPVKPKVWNMVYLIKLVRAGSERIIFLVYFRLELIWSGSYQKLLMEISIL